MQYKTELKEKFTVIKISDKELSSNLVPELTLLTNNILEKAPRNLVLNLTELTSWGLELIECIADAQEKFYDNNASFVICCLSTSLQDSLDASDFAEMMNITPTETEAWDIVQMEEIERELLDSDDMEFNTQE